MQASKPSSRLPNAVYGFIGLGNMGFGMAKNLRASMPEQCKLVVCELNTQRRDEFISLVDGTVEAADSPRQIAEHCVRSLCDCSIGVDVATSKSKLDQTQPTLLTILKDIIVTSLPNGEAVKRVFLDPSDGLLSATPTTGAGVRKRFFLESSTIEVTTSNEVLRKVKQSGLGDFIDCPVSGGIPAAEQGNLTFMVGGSEELFNRAKPILASMGKEENIIFCGPPGAGLATKQINNYVANVSYIALCEGTLHLSDDVPQRVWPDC